MHIEVKHFRELTTEELWKIYEPRSRVFVVEQSCPYQDVDEYDKQAYHLLASGEGDTLKGYARILPKRTVFDEVSIGRVISMKRRSGLGTQIVAKAIETAVENFQAEVIEIEAQVYAAALYRKAGFQIACPEFLEDGIPHIKMRWTGQDH